MPGRELIDKGDRIDAVIVNASGCGTTVKDYGHLLKREPQYAERAAKLAAHDARRHRVPRQLRHGPAQALVVAARRLSLGLLDAARPAHHRGAAQAAAQRRASPWSRCRRAHLCCGSAGTYNILQPEIAADLRDRKVDNIKRVRPDVVATGNIGCITQLASGMDIPIAHTVELLDWAYGGPMPRGLEKLAATSRTCPTAKPLIAVT